MDWRGVMSVATNCRDYRKEMAKGWTAPVNTEYKVVAATQNSCLKITPSAPIIYIRNSTASFNLNLNFQQKKN